MNLKVVTTINASFSGERLNLVSELSTEIWTDNEKLGDIRYVNGHYSLITQNFCLFPKKNLKSLYCDIFKFLKGDSYVNANH